MYSVGESLEVELHGVWQTAWYLKPSSMNPDWFVVELDRPGFNGEKMRATITSPLAVRRPDVED